MGSLNLWWLGNSFGIQAIPTGCVIPDEGIQGSCVLKEHKNVGMS